MRACAHVRSGDPAESAPRRVGGARRELRGPAAQNPGCPQRRRANSVRAPGAIGARVRLGCALLALFAELLSDALAPKVRQVIDAQLSLEGIHFVLDAHRENVPEIPLEGLAVALLSAHPDLRGARHLIENPGHREAALLGIPVPPPPQALRGN